jgi:hypothetical protein
VTHAGGVQAHVSGLCALAHVSAELVGLRDGTGHQVAIAGGLIAFSGPPLAVGEGLLAIGPWLLVRGCSRG